MEDRSKMEKAMRFSDMHINFVFGFLDETFRPVELDLAYGKFELYQHNYFVDDDNIYRITETKVGVKSKTFDEDDNVEKWGALYNMQENGGIYTAEDFDLLSLKGSSLDYNIQYVVLKFVPCQDFSA